jgi:hypothetical protein
MVTNHARSTLKIKFKITMAKAAFNKQTLFTSKLDLNLRKKLGKCYIWSIVFMALNIRHSGKEITKAWKVLKCGAGEGWKR